MSVVEDVAGNLLLVADSVNVGLLRSGERALAIDCGTGAFVDDLAGLGIRHLAWVLATHHHRDGCSGLPRCRAAGAQLAVPAAEQALFDDVGRHWLAPESQFHRYRLQPGTNVLATSVAIDRALAGGDTFAWEQFTIQVVATPGGLDDYCAHNRNLLGPGRGYERCLDLLEHLQPDLLVNMHVPLPFILPPAFLTEARTSLRARARLLTAMLPWEHPNCGLDPQWLRLYPYHQMLNPGSRGRVQLQVSNSASTPMQVRTILKVPDGWQTLGETGGVIAPESDGAFMTEFSLPTTIAAGRYVLTAQVWVYGRNLGDWVEALVDVDVG